MRSPPDWLPRLFALSWTSPWQEYPLITLVFDLQAPGVSSFLVAVAGKSSPPGILQNGKSSAGFRRAAFSAPNVPLTISQV
jgi:hypothetical protein